MSRLCFDIETEPFSAAFLEAKSRSEKLRAAPTMRIACVYSEDDRKYRFYTAEQAPALIAVLLAASEVISFNGKAFDVLVLRRHYGLIGTLPRRGKHTDLHELLTERAGFRVSLNSAVALNFDEKKHTSGREMAKVNGTELS